MIWHSFQENLDVGFSTRWFFEQLKEILSVPERIQEHAVDHPRTPRPAVVTVALLVKCVRLAEAVRLFVCLWAGDQGEGGLQAPRRLKCLSIYLFFG